MTVRRAPARGRRAPRAAATKTLSIATDLGRALTALLSGVVPGIGQLINGHRGLAIRFALPFLVVAGVAYLIVQSSSGSRLVAAIISPGTMTLLLAVNGVILAWRLGAILHAFFDPKFAGRPTRAGWLLLGVLLVGATWPHMVLHGWGTTASAAFERMFTGEITLSGGSIATVASKGPADGERVNILLVGIDKAPWRDSVLTDSMMVLSVDPVGETATMVSLPRDLVRVPLGDGERYGPKLNSLHAYATSHPERFPQGGMRALADAVGALLDIRIHYTVEIGFFRFVELVDAIGGVDIEVKKGFYDETYDGIGIDSKEAKGWGVEAGLHHFNGWEALAYSRARKAGGESDFTRASRQQEVLLAIRDKVLSDGDLLWRLPELIETFGDLIRTDIPVDRLPALAALAGELDGEDIVRVVLKKPLVGGTRDAVYGSVQVPDIDAIHALTDALFPAPGTPPTPWPTPRPTGTPEASTAP